MHNPLYYHLPSFPKKLSTETPLVAQMAKKADAWKEYEEAALVDMMLKVAWVIRYCSQGQELAIQSEVAQG